ncbi:hypothetical protein Vqi01_06540 [Micromonospora qiuiae]|uniref:Flavin reductase n=1 Tax=Micromonospora qiuiae TaxID=502268 RepID=A0ABQ4J5Q9_9ACTN|nr:hypothetical protein [Micromonospora qiuiae]GIJ25492.1 hypothetical protein Vqi01_06540 [Micromonospora qiuiae]
MERPITYREAMTQQTARATRAVGNLPVRLADQHMPLLAVWTCATCDAPWPCPPAQVQLTEYHGRDRISLSMYMGALLTAALADLPDVDPGELTTRFLAWTRCICREQ